MCVDAIPPVSLENMSALRAFLFLGRLWPSQQSARDFNLSILESALLNFFDKNPTHGFRQQVISAYHFVFGHQ